MVSKHQPSLELPVQLDEPTKTHETSPFLASEAPEKAQTDKRRSTSKPHIVLSTKVFKDEALTQIETSRLEPKLATKSAHLQKKL